jgi:hypothetical protein
MTIKFWVGIGLCSLIALAGALHQRYGGNPRCEYDGSSIAPIYEVEIVLKDRSAKKFCSMYCAKQWFDHNAGTIDHVIVTDEIRGNKIESSIAYFVKSTLITNKANGNCIHAFQQRQAALTHAEKFGGFPAEDPFELDK